MKNIASHNAVELDQTDIPPGQVRRRIGDVFNHAKREYVVESVSPSRAVARCLAKGKVSIVKIKGDSETAGFEINDPAPNLISVSNCCDRQDVIRHIENYQSTLNPSPVPCK